ncbi:MAG: helix-turn-helix domain-containing protein [Firmicutes bacterium]|nr:helix-turn-helix domain-containing protein [Bacillota bacterium]
MGELEFKETVAKRIIMHRKRLGLTQAELGEKLNYTDKSVSKWERGETLPDVLVLKQLAELFGITVDDFINQSKDPNVVVSNIQYLFKRKKIAVPILAVLLTIFIAATTYSLFMFFDIPFENLWLIFVYAIPASAIVLIVFSSMWWKKSLTALFVSLLNWSLILALFLSTYSFNNKSWVFFIIAATFQSLIIAWLVFYNGKRKIKN